MIKDKTLKNIATVLSGLNCSTILTLEQVAWNRKRTKLIKEKSLYIMFFGFKNKKICFDVVFRNFYFYITSFRIEKINKIATVTIK